MAPHTKKARTLLPTPKASGAGPSNVRVDPDVLMEPLPETRCEPDQLMEEIAVVRHSPEFKAAVFNRVADAHVENTFTG